MYAVEEEIMKMKELFKINFKDLKDWKGGGWFQFLLSLYSNILPGSHEYIIYVFSKSILVICLPV